MILDKNVIHIIHDFRKSREPNIKHVWRLCFFIFLWYSHTEDRDTNMVPLAQMAVLPKHCHLPEIPSDPNMSFEAMLYFFGVIAMGLQYINLYRTVWWLPHSHANYALVTDTSSIYNFNYWIQILSQECC